MSGTSVADRKSKRSCRLLALMLAAAVCDGAAVSQAHQAAAAQVEAFDGQLALDHAAAMVALGPRPLGSEALEQTRQYIETQLEAFGLTPSRDSFDAKTPLGTVAMANIVATIDPADGGADRPVIILAGHFDTKLFERVEFLGANDGASSAAILLELARVLVAHPASLPVRLVFFDGEEAAVVWTDDDSTYGSRHMVQRLEAEGGLDEIGALVLFDMIGDAQLQIPREGGSTGWLTDVIWQAASDAGHAENFPNSTHFILDDHLPFIEAGVDAVDLIDFSYGPGNRYWHAPFDTLDRLSADSFQSVGETMLTALPRIEERLRQ